ncbi:MAG: class I SAM-dependent methyltransferase [Chloroflexota bacterium]
MNDIYSTGGYLEKNPGWHAGDSPWKAAQILKMMRKHDLQPATVCEVGCGAGEILVSLYENLDDAQLTGYEISPQAFELCKAKEKERLRFFLGDLLETQKRFALLLCIDVFEHIPNYLAYLEQLREHADHFVFHIPLDLSLLTILRPARLLQTRRSVGHLHMFTEELALAALRDTGYEIMDSFFTAGGVELEKNKRRIRTVLANLPRRIVGSFSQRLAARLLGGYSLLVLAR